MSGYPKIRDEKRVLDAAAYDGYSLIMVPNELAPKVSALIAKYDEREAAQAAKARDDNNGD